MNVNLINYSTQKGLILEKIEEKDSIVKKTLLDLGGIIDGTFTFGTGITAMLPAVKQLMTGSTPQLTEQDIIILYITAMWILVGKHKEKVTKLLEIIKEKGLTESLNTVFNFLESLEDVVLKIGKSLGYTANSLTDIVAFTFLAFPILDGILFLMNQGFIDYGSPTGYLKSILFGVGILGFKNIFNHIIKKLGGKLEKLDETNYLNEGVGFYDETLLMVNDVMSIVKSTITDKNEKTYYLPEDLRNEELIYDIENYIFTIELTISRDETIEDEFNIDARINNDVNCFVLGEKHFGKGRKFKDIVGLAMGTGLGGGIIIDNKLYSGNNGGAGEFGLMQYLDKNYEFYCSGQFFRDKYGKNGEELLKKAKKSDNKAIKIFEEFGNHIGNLINSILYALNPEIIILGGSVSSSYSYFKYSMLDSLKKHEFKVQLSEIKIRKSTLKYAAVLGAAKLCS